jgi:hypothetical protein
MGALTEGGRQRRSNGRQRGEGTGACSEADLFGHEFTLREIIESRNE